MQYGTKGWTRPERHVRVPHLNLGRAFTIVFQNRDLGVALYMIVSFMQLWLAESISEETERQAGHLDQLREALRPCMRTLSAGNRELVEHRYFRAMSISDIAQEVDRTVSAVKVALLRSRRHLSECIERRMAAEGDA